MSMTSWFADPLFRLCRPLLHCSFGAGGSTSVAVLPARRLSRALLPIVAAALIAVMVQPVLGQGGATMSAGQSMQNSANSAAGQANRNAGGTVPPSSSPNLSTPPASPSGLEGYSGTGPTSADYPGYGPDYPGYGYESVAPGGAAAGAAAWPLATWSVRQALVLPVH